MHPLPVMESFDKALLKLPTLLDAPAHQRVELAEQWLTRVVALAEEFHLPLAADLGLFKADLTTYRPGQGEGANGRKLLLQRYAAECLGRAKTAVDATFARQRDLCGQGAEICLQIAATAAARGLVSPGDSVETVLAKLRADDALLPALTQVIGAVGAANTTVLLDRALAQV